MEPAKNSVQIRVKGLPSKWKDVSFQDRKYITDIRFYRIENGTTVYETEEAFKSADYKNIFLNLPVATFSYQRNILEIDISENIELSEIQQSEDILVIDENNLWHQCRVENVEYEKQDVSTLFKVIVTLQIIYIYDGAGQNRDLIENNNFYNDFVTSTYVTEKYRIPKLYNLVLQNYENVDNDINLINGINFYTKFYPKIGWEDLQVDKTILSNYDVCTNKVAGFKYYLLRFYLTETERNLLKKYADICYYKNTIGENSGAILRFNMRTICKSIKPIEVNYIDNKELNNIGIFPVDVKVFSEKLNYSTNLNK